MDLVSCLKSMKGTISCVLICLKWLCCVINHSKLWWKTGCFDVFSFCYLESNYKYFSRFRFPYHSLHVMHLSLQQDMWRVNENCTKVVFVYCQKFLHITYNFHSKLTKFDHSQTKESLKHRMVVSHDENGQLSEKMKTYLHTWSRWWFLQ